MTKTGDTFVVPGKDETAALATKLAEAIGQSHSDIALPALAAVFAAILHQLPGMSVDEAIAAFAHNVKLVRPHVSAFDLSSHEGGYSTSTRPCARRHGMTRSLADAERDYDHALAVGARAVEFMDEKLKLQKRQALLTLVAVVLANGGKVEVSHADLVMCNDVDLVIEENVQTMGITIMTQPSRPKVNDRILDDLP